MTYRGTILRYRLAAPRPDPGALPYARTVHVPHPAGRARAKRRCRLWQPTHGPEEYPVVMPDPRPLVSSLADRSRSRAEAMVGGVLNGLPLPTGEATAVVTDAAWSPVASASSQASGAWPRLVDRKAARRTWVSCWVSPTAPGSIGPAPVVAARAVAAVASVSSFHVDSDPVRPDPAAAGQVVAVLGGELLGVLQEIPHPGVGHPVDNVVAPPLRLGHPAPLEAGQVVGDPALWGPDQVHQLRDRSLPLQQRLQDLQPSAIAEHPEVPRHGLLLGDARCRHSLPPSLHLLSPCHRSTRRHYAAARARSAGPTT